MPSIDDSRVLVDAATRDDAAVYQISDERALVATLDFFTPIVDDAYAFGTIAAANAFSDIYAMGAKPLFALNLVGWPRDPGMLELLGETLRGGSDIARQAGVFVLGGHSVDDREPKYGMVVIGEVHPHAVIRNAGARPGDKLVLTKPIGTGILGTGLKRDMVQDADLEAAVLSMSTLNAGAAEAMRAIGEDVHAATDITGFGLLGHLAGLLEASACGATVFVNEVPVFDRVRGLIEDQVIPGGSQRNLDAADKVTSWHADISDTDRVVVTDAQTSGGLLIAVAAARVEDLLQELRARSTPAAAVIGEVTDGSGIEVM